MSHTQGPWIQSIDNGRVIEAGRTKVAIASPTFPPPVAWENARLIAAAPEMLAILKRIIAVDDRGDTPSPSLMEEALAVVKKAEP